MPFYLPVWSIQPASGLFVGASNQMLYAWSALYGATDPAPAKYDAEIWVGGVLVTTVTGIQSQGQGVDLLPGVDYKQFGIDIGPSIVAAKIESPDYYEQYYSGMGYASVWTNCLKEVYIVLTAYVEDSDGFIVALADLDLLSETIYAIKGSVGPYDRTAPDSAWWINELGGSFAAGYALPLSNRPLIGNTAKNSLEQMSFIRNDDEKPRYIGIIYTQEDGTIDGATIEMPAYGSGPDYLQISVGPESIFLNGALYSGTLPTGPLASYQFFLTDGSTVKSPVFERTVLKCATVSVVFMNAYGAWDEFVFTSGLNQSDVNSSNELYRIPVTGIYSGDNVMRMQEGRQLATVRSDQRYMVECDLRSFESAWLTELQRTPKLYLNDMTVDGGWQTENLYGWPTPVTRDNAEQVRKQANKDVTRFRLSGTYAMTLPTIEL